MCDSTKHPKIRRLRRKGYRKNEQRFKHAMLHTSRIVSFSAGRSLLNNSIFWISFLYFLNIFENSFYIIMAEGLQM